ncbi:MAG TPA: DegT/DnrJ/EryC1/StrS family aminotransferase [Gemmatimonadaceae bacterium]|nr:DegT/DnrJ/EryC1/StrS family aminotransferase [Gemmatimonadaceae bacterium]
MPPAHTSLSPQALVRAAWTELTRYSDSRASLEQLLRTRYEAEGVLLMDSGTHALERALRLAAHFLGGPVTVALPAYTCFDVATAAAGAGVRIALYDVNPNTLAPDLDSLEKSLAAGARVAVVTPLYGIPVDWDAIERCASPHGALVIEDAAQGHGSSWRQRSLGSWGRLSVLSFGRGKGWTGGCGGALLARSGISVAPEGVHLDGRLDTSAAQATAAFLRAVGQWVFSRPNLFALAAALPGLHVGETPYHDPVPARGLPSLAAALLDSSVMLCDREGEVRRANAALLLADIMAVPTGKGSPLGLVPPPPNATAGYLRLPLRLAGGLEGFVHTGRAQQLGAARSYPSTLAGLPAVRDRINAADTNRRWPGADQVVQELVTLPTHSLVTPSDRSELLRLLGVRQEQREASNLE